MTWISPLRRIRIQRGLTVEALADLAKVSPSLITLRERSKRGFMRLDTARAIAKALEVSLTDLWPEEESK